MTQITPPVTVKEPPISILGFSPCRPVDWGMAKRPRIKRIILIIAERKKIHCHPMVDVKAPESNNPVTAPIATVMEGEKNQG
jgi:hypothetical protein